MGSTNLVDLNELLAYNEDEQTTNAFSSSKYYDIETFRTDFSKFATSEYLSIINVNIRSLINNKDNLIATIKALGQTFDIITLEETWLDENIEDLANIEGYTSYFKHKLNTKIGGGLGILVSNKIHSTLIDDILVPNEDRDRFDCLFVEVLIKNTKFVVGNFYRSPSFRLKQDVTDFTSFINQTLSKLENEKSNKIICGDMNIDLLKYPKDEVMTYLDSFLDNGYIPKITLPTRVDTTSTLIDHLFTKITQQKAIAGTILENIADHYPNFLFIKISKETHIPKFVTYRQITDTKIETLKTELSNLNWEDITNIQDPTIAYDIFLSKVSSQIDKHLPMVRKKFKRTSHKINPWITTPIINSLNARNKLYIKYKREKNEQKKMVLKNEYNEYRNSLAKQIRNAKTNYWHNKFNEAQRDPKNTWNYINQILSRKVASNEPPTHIQIDDKCVKNEKEIAEAFNNYFSKVGSNLSSTIKNHQTSPLYSLRGDYSNTNFFIFGTTDEEVLKTIQKLKSKSSSGIDGINSKLLKQIATSILVPLTHIFNLTFTTGIIPDKLKIAKVIPIFKSGEKELTSNYRPISLLPTISKVLERLMFDRLTDYCSKYKILIDEQYGFRKSRTTEQAIIDFQDHIIQNINNKLWSLGIFLDLSKAFDTLNHDILINKLEYYGIRGLGQSWFKNYLTGRKQLVSLGNTQSPMTNITHGVPQGSILGPLLFLIYINDIKNTSNIGKFILFADDTSIIYSDENLEKLYEKTNKDIQNINTWFEINKLSVNVKKTKAMLLNTKYLTSNAYHPTKLKINNLEISHTPTFKFLGVEIHENLSWDTHITNINSKISRTSGILCRLKRELPTSTLRLIYCSLLQSRMLYAIIPWYTECQSKSRMITIQKKAIRHVAKAKYNSHTEPLFKKLNLLKVNDLHSLNCCKLYLQAKNNESSHHITNQLVTNLEFHQRTTRQASNIHVPKLGPSLVNQKSSHKIGKSWNNLPTHLKINNIPPKSFTRLLKTHFIETYKEDCRVPDCYTCTNN